MRQGSTASRPSAEALPGVTVLETGSSGFLVWNVALDRAGSGLPVLADRLAKPPERGAAAIGGVALDASGVDRPDAVTVRSLSAFADDVQVRGLPVVVHGASGGLLAAIGIEGEDVRFPLQEDLAGAVRLLRKYDSLRRESISSRGRERLQLRLPAHAASLAPLTAFVRDRLERAEVDAGQLQDLLFETYEALADVLREAYDPGEGEISAAVTVDEHYATVTLLDRGRPRVDAPSEAPGRWVDRIHRFRIPEEHNAAVLEKRRGKPEA